MASISRILNIIAVHDLWKTSVLMPYVELEQ